MTYIEGFIAAVPTANKEKYRQHAEEAAVLFKKHGALKLVESWGMTCRKAKSRTFTAPFSVKMMKRSSSPGSYGPTKPRATPEHKSFRGNATKRHVGDAL